MPKKTINSRKYFLGMGLVILIGLAVFFFLAQKSRGTDIVEVIKKGSVIMDTSKSLIKKRDVSHVKTPSPAKIAYMTSWVAGTSSIREPLLDFIVESEFNGVLIDIKDDTGRISYKGSDTFITEEVGSYENRIPDLPGLIAELHSKGLYVIGRIAVFQDPHLTSVWPEDAVQTPTGTVWKDRKGLSWMDASSKRTHDYVIRIARESYDLGFDEINFDYVRFPTDGAGEKIYPLSGDKGFPAVIGKFFAYLEEELETDEYGDMVRSADLFGLTTSASDDLGIGQVIEDAAKHFDFVAPMTYPSHYGPGFAGIQNPNSDPGGIIYQAMIDVKAKFQQKIQEELEIFKKPLYKKETNVDPETGTESTSQSLSKDAQKKIDKKEEELKKIYDFKKIRPWLQDFDYGGDYGYNEVRAQIDAVYRSGLDSWMIWDPANKYTKEAYKK